MLPVSIHNLIYGGLRKVSICSVEKKMYLNCRLAGLLSVVQAPSLYCNRHSIHDKIHYNDILTVK